MDSVADITLRHPTNKYGSAKMKHLFLILVLMVPSSVWSDEPKEAKSEAIVALDTATKLAGTVSYYIKFTGSIPTEESGLASLVTAPKDPPLPRRWKKLLDKLPKDPWGSDFVFVVEEVDDNPDLIRLGVLSKGPDGELGGGDEVLVSWIERLP